MIHVSTIQPNVSDSKFSILQISLKMTLILSKKNADSEGMFGVFFDNEVRFGVSLDLELK